MKSSTTVTLADFINSKDYNELNYHAFDIYDVSKDGSYLVTKNILHDYIEELNELCYNVYLSIDEQRKYSYRPRLLANLIYGNPNMYYILLLINNMADEKEFNRSPIKVIKPQDLVEALSAIYGSNSDMLKYHKDKYENKV